LRKQNQQQARQGSGPLELFGLGVCVPAYVQDGCVVSQPASGCDKTAPLTRTLSELFGWAVPVVVENDVNALAVLATYSIDLPEPDIAVVAVFDGGLGGGLVMDGRLRRGGAGMAMEVGHLSVGCAPGGLADGMGPSLAGFDPTCTCGALGHLNAFAVPRRIRAVLGVDSNAEAAALPAGEPEARTRYYDVFRAAGGALGGGLVQTVNLVNPTRILLFVPREFVTPGPASAASAYLAGVADELRHAYSTGAEVANLTVRPLGPVEEMGLFCAEAAAVCLFNGFFDHAKGFDNCQLPQRRASRESEASPGA
jgi:predicted NBD/HSP70 family sugar kinase